MKSQGTRESIMAVCMVRRSVTEKGGQDGLGSTLLSCQDQVDRQGSRGERVRQDVENRFR